MGVEGEMPSFAFGLQIKVSNEGTVPSTWQVRGHSPPHPTPFPRPEPKRSCTYGLWRGNAEHPLA